MRLSSLLIVAVFMQLLFASCGNNEKKKETPKVIVFREDPVSRFKKYIGGRQFHRDPFFAGDQRLMESVAAFYDSLQFHFVWFNDSLHPSPLIDSLQGVLKAMPSHGLDNYPMLRSYQKLKTAGKKELFNAETAFTAICFQMALEAGYSKKQERPAEAYTQALQLLLSAHKRQSLLKEVFCLEPSEMSYTRLQQALGNFLLAPADTAFSVDFSEEDDSLEVIRKTGEFLEHYYCLKQDTLTEDHKLYRSLLKKFQRQNGLSADAKPGMLTQQAMQLSYYERYKKAASTLERMRQAPIRDSLYLLINIPSYSLYLVHYNAIIDTFRVVVGKPESPTPELDAKLRYMVVFPEWIVPHSIASKELLPHIKADTAYLSKKNYLVYNRRNELMDPATIKWKKLSDTNFPYRIIRESGTFNDLGLIKFIFPNPHDVFLHDTPSRNLFRKDVRAFSHGCMRVNEALDLASRLLEIDGNEMNGDSVKYFAEKEINKKISLKKALPVYVRYYTAMGGSEGNIYFYGDIYKKEDPLAF